jgi:hypothetical protein
MITKIDQCLPKNNPTIFGTKVYAGQRKSMAGEDIDRKTRYADSRGVGQERLPTESPKG